jgi:signal transduction histidine kinase
LNLINNAFYAVNERQKNEKDSEYKPRVTLTTKKQADQVVIEVADNGTGMPEQVKEKIFQPFFTTKPTGEGTGLGLSLSYDIVTKGHGGTMEVLTREGEGSKIIVRLPL